jgi:hypothetical protein
MQSLASPEFQSYGGEGLPEDQDAFHLSKRVPILPAYLEKAAAFQFFAVSASRSAFPLCYRKDSPCLVRQIIHFSTPGRYYSDLGDREHSETQMMMTGKEF